MTVSSSLPKGALGLVRSPHHESQNGHHTQGFAAMRGVRGGALAEARAGWPSTVVASADG